MPSSRPRVLFNEDGICNSCIYLEKKKKIDWNLREKEFVEICNIIDLKMEIMTVLCRGVVGKDSSSIAHKLKFKYNMNPLLLSL